jgi:hypothetical protein
VSHPIVDKKGKHRETRTEKKRKEREKKKTQAKGEKFLSTNQKK